MLSKDVKNTSAALLPYPTKLFVETTTRCNLSCFMCVKQSDERCIDEGDLNLETFNKILPALPHANALILNGIGEPLLHDQLETFIREAKTHINPLSWIGFQSNGLLLDEHRAYSLLEAGLDRICISIDSVSPDTFKLMREGGELGDIEAALDHLNKAKTSLNRSDFQIGVEFVLMRSNLEELPNALEWAATKGVSFALVTHVLPYDKEHVEEAVYSLCSDMSLKFYLDGKASALHDGIDITRYPQIIWKFNKNEADRKVIEYVEKMKQEAEQDGVFLDLKKLFALDLDWLAHVKNVFTKTQDVADRNGVDLHLPQITLKDERTCEFVEDGSMFISWDGTVHPCYFLWHSYRCFASGWSQEVQPKTFGNLQDQELLDIWNSAEFKGFRKNVISYDYPYCSNCGLAPCDYV
ncbi:MAG: radical SAM/SPASM family putative metalloenzyme maturase, partial [Deltaproteobacteria bacterium]|nr:radical SAM/SPASM family putative metalloenzyme maturase [Deltaproteobacteria bacterium]